MTCKKMYPLSNLCAFLKQTQPSEADHPYTGLPSDWYLKEHITYSFSHPHVMSRLERLMGTNIVVLTDRKYMLELQRRIQEDHVNAIKERIREREKDELDREKNLILKGKIPLTAAPQELMEHPVFRITQMANDFVNELNKYSKKKGPKTSTSSTGEDPCAALNERFLRERPREREVSVAPPPSERLLHSRRKEDQYSESGESKEDVGEEEEEEESDEEEAEMGEDDGQKEESEHGRGKRGDTDIQNGYMFTDSEYERMHFETDHVKAMWTLETVEDLYEMAEQVVLDVVAHRPNGPTQSRPAPKPEKPKPEDSNLDSPEIDSQPEQENATGGTSKTKAPKRSSKAKGEKNRKSKFSWSKKR